MILNKQIQINIFWILSQHIDIIYTKKYTYIIEYKLSFYPELLLH